MKTLLCFCLCIFVFQSNAQVLIHAYELNGTYADDFGGNPLIPNGGTLTATSYEFQGGEGPNISNSINPISYSLEMRFMIFENDYWHKLVDFKDGNSDYGIYVTGGRLFFYPDALPLNVVIENGITYTLTLTRDGATKVVALLVDGMEHLSFEDINNNATFTGPGNIIHLMRDDFRTILPPNHPPENPSGSLDYVRIYEPAVDPCGLVDDDCDQVNDDCDICPGGDDNGPCNASTLPPLYELPYNWLCSNNNNSDKILVCHDGETLCVSENAANIHLSHGDYLGPCSSCPQNTLQINPYTTIPDGNQLEIMPNPASGDVSIEFNDATEKGYLIIYDNLGKQILQLEKHSKESFIHFALEESKFPVGTYYVSWMTDRTTQVKRLIVSR